MKKYWKRMKKLLKKGGEWFTMEASGKKVVRSGTLWMANGVLRLRERVPDVIRRV